MSECSRLTFKWSERELSLKDLIEEYREYIPFPVLVTQGYQATSDRRLSSSVDETYWVHDVIEHTWIVLRNDYGLEFRIPECYDIGVIPIKSDGKDGTEIPFDQVRVAGGFKTFKFRKAVLDVNTGSKNVIKKTEKCSMGELEIIDVYQEKYLVVHPLTMENLMVNSSDNTVVFPQFALLPSYLPVHMTIGVALSMAPEPIYFHTMAEIKILADSYGHERDYTGQLKDNAEIFLMAEKPIGQDYEYIDITKKSKKETAKPPDFKIPLNLRSHPVSLDKEVNPRDRLRQLSVFYETGDMGAVSASISELDDDGYLEPRTWLAIADDDPEDSVVSGDDWLDYDDVFPVNSPPRGSQGGGLQQQKQAQFKQNPQLKHQFEAAKPTASTNSPGVSWLRERFQEAADRVYQTKTNEQAAKRDVKPSPQHVTHTPVHKRPDQPVENSQKRLSVAERIMAFSSNNMDKSTNLATPPPVPPPPPAWKEPTNQVRPPPPCRSSYRRPTIAVSPTERPRPSLAQMDRKYSLDSATTAIVNPFRGNNSFSNVDMVAELQRKIQPRAEKINGQQHLQQQQQQQQQPQQYVSKPAPPYLDKSSSNRRHISHVSDIPSDISGLSTDDISDCLKCLNLSDHIPALRRGMVDGSLLMCLQEDDLKSEFGFSDFNAKKLIQFALNGWRPKP